MRLHIAASGNGPAVAVLLHGMMGSSESWWQLTPLLVERGYRVLAVDLPGHGLSDRDPRLTVPRAAEAVAVAVAAETPGRPPSLALGHSFGGLVLAAAAAALKPELAVYVDAPFRSRGGWNRADVAAEYERDRCARTEEGLAARPDYTATDRTVEARAAERFDPETAAAVAAAAGGTWLPGPGSIVIRPEPSNYIDADTAAELSAQGVHVRSIPGASHSIWRSHFDEFLAALPEVFG